jgi:hypothetical protein
VAAVATVNKQKQLVFVVQSLRGFSVAQKGRIVAEFALDKSGAYRTFFENKL